MPRILSIPDVRQQGESDCGPACAAAVLIALGRGGPTGIVLDDCTERLLTGPEGTDPRTLEAFLRREGLRVQSGEMALADLVYHTQQGRPVVCVCRDHYVVAAGVSYGFVYYHDPLEGTCKEKGPVFLTRWQDVDRLGARYDCFGLAAWRE